MSQEKTWMCISSIRKVLVESLEKIWNTGGVRQGFAGDQGQMVLNGSHNTTNYTPIQTLSCQPEIAFFAMKKSEIITKHL